MNRPTCMVEGPNRKTSQLLMVCPRFIHSTDVGVSGRCLERSEQMAHRLAVYALGPSSSSRSISRYSRDPQWRPMRATPAQFAAKATRFWSLYDGEIECYSCYSGVQMQTKPRIAHDSWPRIPTTSKEAGQFRARLHRISR